MISLLRRPLGGTHSSREKDVLTRAVTDTEILIMIWMLLKAVGMKVLLNTSTAQAPKPRATSAPNASNVNVSIQADRDEIDWPSSAFDQ